ncbi:hypothetical protein KUCAC02_029725 [Chaenocephalus aceratus]|nr:hypothetical protein KUCAC02_029725 [Chaenocephalus aceratus]
MATGMQNSPPWPCPSRSRRPQRSERLGCKQRPRGHRRTRGLQQQETQLRPRKPEPGLLLIMNSSDLPLLSR